MCDLLCFLGLFLKERRDFARFQLYLLHPYCGNTGICVSMPEDVPFIVRLGTLRMGEISEILQGVVGCDARRACFKGSEASTGQKTIIFFELSLSSKATVTALGSYLCLRDVPKVSRCFDPRDPLTGCLGKHVGPTDLSRLAQWELEAKKTS